MKNGKRRKHGNSVIRAGFVALSLLLQIGWLLLLILKLNQYSTYIALLTNLIAALAVLRLYSRRINSAYKMPWIMVIMALPVMGLSLYLLNEASLTPKSVRKRLEHIRAETGIYLNQSPDVMEALQRKDLAAANQCRYLWNQDGSAVYGNTRADYFGEAVDAFHAMKEALERAEHFIFMEYFIVEDRASFDEIRRILTRKASEGVEVRLLYDDVGSIGTANLRFARELNRQGIHCQVFNPALPFLNLFLNNRDHRKITVIDGKVGFTGGYNLADEYFGVTEPYGHWKDTGIRLEGEAVKSLTATFLELWNVTARTKEDLGKYLQITHSVPARGYVQPFGESPLDDEPVAENVFLNMLSHAREYIWFMTPYLIITDELSRAMVLAAKRGVDVRIITPGIPDKKTVYALTRSYYAGLASQGVRIFEYAPGFCHGKQCVCDGEIACIGTSNLDYRSLYLHFENNVLLLNCPAVKAMERDFQEMFPVCREVTEEYRTGRRGILLIWQCILRLFAPML